MSYEEFARARLPVLVRTAAHLCGDLGLAEDLVQEVLIRTHQQWARISRLDARDAYVRRMLVNEYLSWRRKWARIVPVADVRTPDPPVDHSTKRSLATRALASLRVDTPLRTAYTRSLIPIDQGRAL